MVPCAGQGFASPRTATGEGARCSGWRLNPLPAGPLRGPQSCGGSGHYRPAEAWARQTAGEIIRLIHAPPRNIACSCHGFSVRMASLVCAPMSQNGPRCTGHVVVLRHNHHFGCGPRLQGLAPGPGSLAKRALCALRESGVCAHKVRPLRLLMPTSRASPPVPRWTNTRLRKAAISRPDRRAAASPIATTSAVAVSPPIFGPMAFFIALP